jgi:hypothetical protein
VNLVVRNKPKWRELIQEIKSRIADLGEVDLEAGTTVSRKALVEEILRTCGAPATVPDEPNDLVFLNRALLNRSVSRLIMIHFDMVRFRPNYDVNLFGTFRNLMMVPRKLVLLIESLAFFANLLPAGHPLSSITTIQTLELK